MNKKKVRKQIRRIAEQLNRMPVCKIASDGFLIISKAKYNNLIIEYIKLLELIK